MYSVDTEEEARSLITLACPRNLDGEFYARELAEEQTLENLQAFSDRLARTHEMMISRSTQNGHPSTKERPTQAEAQEKVKAVRNRR